MDKYTKNYVKTRMDEIKKISNKMGCEVEILDLNETVIPTVLISIGNNGESENVILTCNIVPIQVEEISMIFLQFYICVSEEISEEKSKIIDDYVNAQNSHFMVGNLMKYEGSIYLKSSISIDPEEKLNEKDFTRNLDIFIYQAGVIVEKIFSLLNESKTLKEVIDNSSFFV